MNTGSICLHRTLCSVCHPRSKGVGGGTDTGDKEFGGWGGGKRHIGRTRRGGTIIWCFFLAVTGFCFGEYERNKTWRDPVTLWQDCLKKSPNKPRSHTNLGFYLIQDNQVEKGVEHYDTALKLNPKFEDAHFNLAQVYGERRLFDQAEAHLRECIRLDPKDPGATMKWD